MEDSDSVSGVIALSFSIEQILARMEAMNSWYNSD